MNREHGAPSPHYRIGCDIGGTFTDLVLLDCATGVLTLHKLLSTPDEPERAILAGIDALLLLVPAARDAIDEVVHASTIANNLVLERKGGAVGLLATRGFRDVLEMRRQERYDMYNVLLELPEPLVPRRRRVDITERLDRNGRVLVPLDLAEVDEAVRALVADGVRSIAISYLHSYADASHEKQTEARIAAIAPGVSVSRSSKVLPEIREYERTSTTVMDAYVKPSIVHYLDALDARLKTRGVGQLRIMLSGGSIASAAVAREHPVRFIESGPSAGVLAAQHYAGMLGLAQCLAFDIGGTTAKVGLVLNGAALKSSTYEVAHVHRFQRGSGLPIQLPAINLLEVGAGGGSIARLDALGLLEVGPESAGAVPGPACYGRGGVAPTVSDADLLLGYLNPDHFAGGEIRLLPDAAAAAIAAGVADHLALSPLDGAKAIHDLVNEKMAGSIRMYCLENGEEPSQFALVATGGAGPVHAYGVARKLGIVRVIIPPVAGAMSAAGLLAAPAGFDVVRTFKRTMRQASEAAVQQAVDTLVQEVAEVLDTPRESLVILSISADMRYIGQGFEITVELPRSGETMSLDGLQPAFDQAYQRLYGHTLTGNDVELVSLRVTARLPGEVAGEMRRGDTLPAAGGAGPVAFRAMHFPGDPKVYDAPVYDRADLAPGAVLHGPLILRDPETSSIVGPECTVAVDRLGGLSLTLAY